mmetsp:Transcript_27906/g.70553  ORF Transcript_27906/g.70553 Transcript_27906/m.70553 type:complete len:239 (+) Transcript_27906:331-1047(+)
MAVHTPSEGRAASVPQGDAPGAPSRLILLSTLTFSPRNTTGRESDLIAAHDHNCRSFHTLYSCPSTPPPRRPQTPLFQSSQRQRHVFRRVLLEQKLYLALDQHAERRLPSQASHHVARRDARVHIRPGFFEQPLRLPSVRGLAAARCFVHHTVRPRRARVRRFIRQAGVQPRVALPALRVVLARDRALLVPDGGAAALLGARKPLQRAVLVSQQVPLAKLRVRGLVRGREPSRDLCWW